MSAPLLSVLAGLRAAETAAINAAGASTASAVALAPAPKTATEGNGVYIFALDGARLGGWSSQWAVSDEVISPPAPVMFAAASRGVFSPSAEGLISTPSESLIPPPSGGLISSQPEGADSELKVVRNGEKGRDELWLTAQFPTAAGIIRRIREDRPMWAHGSAFRAEIYVPSQAGANVSTQLIARHRVWGWFATEPTRVLKPGVWNSVSWDLDEASDEWRSMDESTAWNDSMRQNLTFVGLRFFSAEEALAGGREMTAPGSPLVPSGGRDLLAPGSPLVPSGGRDLPAAVTLRVANMAIEGVHEPAEELKAVDVRFPQTPVKRGQCFEITFDLTRAYDNPFDPDDVAVDVDFLGYPDGGGGAKGTAAGVGAGVGAGVSVGSVGLVGPVGPVGLGANTSPGNLTTAISSATLPAFWFQDFTRRRLEDGGEACDPRGKACWKARFTPRMSGPYSFRIRARDHTGARYESPLYSFNIADAPFRGFVRIDLKDPRYLSFDGDNSLFYPIGMVIRSPWDSRCGYHYEFEPPENWETYIYDAMFKRMSESGMNIARVWMAAWWLALEWSRGYRQDFEGLGRYSQFNSWRMDHIIRQGERYGVYFDITLNNHGQFVVVRRLDQEWPDNPAYLANGGHLQTSSQYWTDPKTRQDAYKRMRYIIGRWGYSTSIAWFLVCNEINLVHNYNSNDIRSWHEFITTTVKTLDPYKHLCAAHVCYGTFDPNVGGQPWMDIKQSNGYAHDMIASVNYLWKQLGAYNLPAYINEYGVGWNSPDYMLYNLHGGLWASSMAPFCGPAMHWYCLYIHFANKYDQYSALAAFHRDEDYRGLNLAPSQNVTITSADKQLEIAAQQSDERVYLWLYDKTLFRQGVGNNPAIKQFAEPTFAVGGLKPGKYRVEFWDTWKGGEIAAARQETDLTTGSLAVKAPTFSRDIACKIKRAGEK
ncbi:MAG: hypothetical protein NTX50_11035 [Candidatus Sumerlaeota bacterium]|nr:hypothetical protein [Candidatus Sumerlaeota bacterium]